MKDSKKRIVSHMHISLDGYTAGKKGEMDWIKFDDKMFDFVKTLTDAADTACYGRVTWQMMDDYWPQAASRPNASKHDREHSHWYNTVEKIVFSHTIQDPDKEKTTFIGDGFTEYLRELKQQTGKDILLLGSPSTTRFLMKENLIDDYWLFVNPIVLGKGIPMFPELKDHLQLKHRETRDFSCGVTALKYSAD